MIRRILLASAGALALTGAAFAADLPSRAPPPVYLPPPLVYTWTGLYLGINAGYTWGASNAVVTRTAPNFGNTALGCGLIAQCPTSAALAAASVVGLNTDGFIGGGQIGYNLQFYNSWLIGIEADIQGVAGGNRSANAFGNSGPISGFAANSYSAATQVTKSLDYLGTVRGRFGFLLTPSLLVFGSGGLAYGGVKSSVAVTEVLNGPSFTINPFLGGSSFSNTRVGYTAGGGAEWMFLPNWSAKVEYLYYDLGRVTTNFNLLQLNGASVPFIGFGAQSTTRFNGHVVRAGLNYHFNLWGPAPVVARY